MKPLIGNVDLLIFTRMFQSVHPTKCLFRFERLEWIQRKKRNVKKIEFVVKHEMNFFERKVKTMQNFRIQILHFHE